MLLKTYKKILKLFRDYRGYMSAAELRKEGVSSSQIRELVDSGELRCFTRGFYWHNNCGIDLPVRYRYIEVYKADSQAVICLDSAAYLHGILSDEPDAISFATPRDDRRKFSFDFPTHRYYFQNTGDSEEIQKMQCDGHEIVVYGVERTLCDCIRIPGSLNSSQETELENYCRTLSASEARINRLMTYANLLRAGEPVRRKMEKLYD